MRTILAFCMLIPALIVRGQDRITGRMWATRSEAIGQHGMACTSQPLATIAALDVLKAGGTAVDAAIAANALLGVVEPTGCGIGGDLFAIVYDAKTGQLYGLNGSGRTPKGMSYANLMDELQQQDQTNIPAYGPLPVTIPGCVDGWFALHSRFGKLPMSDLLGPAIGYARDGFPVTELISYYWQSTMRWMTRYPGIAENFTVDGKRGPATGEVIQRRNLANTLDIIAREGRDGFYKGKMAQRMVDYLRAQGGYHTLEDFSQHSSEWVTPVSTSYRGYDVYELPPNGQGIAALQMLNILEGFDFSRIPFGSPEHIHLFVEAKKLAFEDRARLYADMAFAEVPVARLISKAYAAERRQLINPDRAARSYEPGILPQLKEGDTVYLTVADKDGNMVSLIQSNYRGMGSGMCVPELGFIFQDRGELFSLDPNHANCYAPGKRPFHTIIPAFVMKDGIPFLSFGVMGGGFQPLGHVQILMNLIDFGMNTQEAGDAPRINHEGSTEPTDSLNARMTDGGTVTLESGFLPETLRRLQFMGHTLGYSISAYGGYQAIRYDPVQKVYYGASESRKDGMAAGY